MTKPVFAWWLRGIATALLGVADGLDPPTLPVSWETVRLENRMYWIILLRRRSAEFDALPAPEQFLNPDVFRVKYPKVQP